MHYTTDVAVIISAIIIWKLHSPQRFYADPAVSLAISLIIFGSAIPMSMLVDIFCFATPYHFTALKSGRLLLEAAPLYLDLEKVKGDLLSVCNPIYVSAVSLLMRIFRFLK